METDITLGNMDVKQMHLCFVGNMLGQSAENTSGQNAKYVTTQGQIVADLFAADGYKVTSVSSKVNRAKRLTDIISTLINGHRKFDIVLLDAYSGLNVINADVTGFLCRIFKLPLVMILRGGNLPEFVQKYPRWAKRVLNRADHLVAPSSYLAEKIGASGYEIQVVSNVIDISRYPYRERSKIAPRIIWMRSFHPVYNPEMAIKVLAKLKQSRPEATLVMAGADKGFEEKTKLLAQELGVSDAVRFTGFLDLNGKLKEFSDADIYINTNRIDNMPVSVVEARALGLPVVATNVGGLPYLIEHGENGLLVESEYVDAMVGNIDKLLDDPDLTRKISRNGRNLAERSAWTAVRQDLELMIEKVLNEKLTENKISSLENKVTS